MQFITTGNRIAVENFEIGYFYTIYMLNGEYFQACCTGIGSDFVMFSRDEPDLLFSLTMQSAEDISRIELYGGGSGTNDYNDLGNKPQINGITLIGNKSLSDLGIQETISDLDTIRSGAAAGATAVQPADLATALATKQDTISDLNTIRSGAAAGATAVQPADLATALATKQDTLSSGQLAAANSGIDSTKVAQIETNKNNILSCKEFTDNATIDINRKLYISATEPTGNIPLGSTWINGKTVKVAENGNVWQGTIEQGSWSAADLTKIGTTTRSRTNSAMSVYVGNTYEIVLTGAVAGVQFVAQYRDENGTTVSESGWKTSPYSAVISQGITQITLIFKNENSANCTPQDVGTLAINTIIWQ